MRTLDERMPYLTITRPKTVHNIVRITVPTTSCIQTSY